MIRYTNGDALDIIENEGIGYAVRDYCSGHNFEDPITAHLWDTSSSALSALTEYLQKQTGRKL